ncbi:hypothetical protein M407DRAFT_26400 [Tulasnella calospora MUT 4182]|uniref:Uncharacterized protein n=1 Tax=Tulasnella calospora MUT 4182 TaxID=1051891 RepID=A0A0C3QFT0_9AGAM|nr:hypothetical protein M407DRAFT_26400 [Tulasnella calospora MUT 4182]
MVGGGGLWGQLASLAPQPPPPTVGGGRGSRPAFPAPQAPPPTVGGGQVWSPATPAPQPPPPADHKPTVTANTVQKNYQHNDVVFPCGCAIRILKLASGASAPTICLTCTSTTRKNSDAQTDPNDGPKATATAAVQTEGSSAINDESSPQNTFEPFKLSYTCGCVVHTTNPPWICPTCGGGVFDVHSFDNSSLLKNSGSKEPPLSQTSSSGQEQQTPTNSEPKADEDDDSRIVSVYFG